jgi:hypothetical protein
MAILFLDVSCLNRSFDDQRQDRIRLEAEAVERIMERLHIREWEWVGSEVEISKTPDPERRHRVTLLASSMHRRVVVFLTTDDKLLRLALRYVDALKIEVANPLAWLQKGGK